MDDIDHLGNRRIRSVGELLQNQFRIGLARMERVVRERMSIPRYRNFDTTTIDQHPSSGCKYQRILRFFSSLLSVHGSNEPTWGIDTQTSSFSLRTWWFYCDRAGYEVRDVHYSHYGRMCPIETPEGPNIGLINSLSSYAKVNKFGFIETPYRRVDRETGRVTDQIDYLTADIEDHYAAV